MCPSAAAAIEEQPVKSLHWTELFSQRQCLTVFPQFVLSGRWSGMNMISHPDWVKLCVELNYAPNQNTKIPSATIQRKRKFGGLSPNSICLGKSSGPNGIRHPHWVKIYDETNGQNNLRAKHTKFFLLHHIYINYVKIFYCFLLFKT